MIQKVRSIRPTLNELCVLFCMHFLIFLNFLVCFDIISCLASFREREST